MTVRILSPEEYTSSTVTMVATLNRSINTRHIAEYLPVVHLFNNKGERVKLHSGTRDGINFFGRNGIIITSCYKDIRRGVRLGAMNNMICADLQILDRNVHIKISESIITSVGTCGYENGKIAFNCIIEHMNRLKENINYIKNLDEEEYNLIIKWIRKNCINRGKLKKLSEIKLPFHLDNRAIKILLSYIDDFDEHESEEYVDKIKYLRVMDDLFEGKLNEVEPKIYNSVYHIKMCDIEKRISLHKMAPYLLDKGISTEFHNWTSEGVNICFPIDNNQDISSQNKEYKHRFTVHEKSSMRQCSPAFKEESYKYYINIMKHIKDFIDGGQKYDDFKKYVSEEPISI
jgi:hypothetical protein